MLRWLRRLFSDSTAAPAIPAPAAPAAPFATTPVRPPASAQPPAPPPGPAPAFADAATPVSIERPAPTRVPDGETVDAPAAPSTGTAAMVPAHPRPMAPPVPFDQLERVDAAWNGWLFAHAGADDAGLDMNAQESRVLDALQAILSSKQSGAALVRRMPGLVPQLLQSLRSDNFSGSALSRTISSDVVLVEAVIRLANSAYISHLSSHANGHPGGAGTSIDSVEKAVILIGQEGLRQLITTVAFRPIIDIHSGYYVRLLTPRLWELAERCAAVSRRLAAEGGIEPFDAFLAALLQNVGLIVALRVMDSAVADAPALGSALFVAQLARATRQLSAGIGREWHFPDTVVQALVEQGGVRKGTSMSPLGRLLQLTDYLGKVRVLAEQGLFDDADGSWFAGLPAEAARGYALLAESRTDAASAGER